MMDVILVTKYIVGNMSKRLRQGYTSSLFYCRKCFNSYTLVTRQSTSIEVGVAPMYQAFKKVGCGYIGIVSA